MDADEEEEAIEPRRDAGKSAPPPVQKAPAPVDIAPRTRRTRRDRVGARARRAQGFLSDLFRRLGESDIFFMAGAISFNIIVAIVPLFLLAVGIVGFVLAARFGEPTDFIMNFILDSLPAMRGEAELEQTVEGLIDQILGERTGFSVVGAVFFIWFSTRLVGTLRTVLRDVFEVGDDRGTIRGKLFDAEIVVIVTFLAMINLGVSLAVRAFQDFGIDLLGLEERGVAGLLETVVGDLLAFGSIWTLFLLIFRYLPYRGVPWRVAVIGATVTAIFYETMKFLFGWYATRVADYTSVYGSLGTIAILFFWIYYGSVVFVLGGYVAQTYRVRRQERLVARKGGDATSVAAT